MMKMIIKKALSTFLAGILTFSFVTVCFSEKTTSVSDVEIDEMYLKAAEFLEDLGILSGDDEGNLLLENTVTRAELSAMITRILGYDNSTGIYSSTSFKDIDENHWASGSIAMLSSLNIINGFDDGMFYPDNTVTIEQIAKILVCALGYDFSAQRKGEYPQSYMRMASELGILDGVAYKSGEELTRAKVALLIYNALFVDLVTYELSGSNVEMSMESSGTLLETKLNIAKGIGIVTGTEITKLSVNGNTPDDYVEIGNKSYHIGTSDVVKYLGYNVEFYYDTEDEMKTIISAKPYRTGVIEVKSDDLISLSNATINYYADSREKHARISQTADYIYNGKVDLTFNPENENVFLYNYKLIDNDNDNVYDVVFVKRYRDILVSKVDAENHRIYDKINQSVIYDFIPGEVDTQICLDGEFIEIKDLRQNDVLSIYYSKDESFADIEVSRKRVAGSISSMSDDEYYINGEKYELSGSFSINETLELGYAGTFYLNAEGKIVASDIKQKLRDGEYGYLIRYGSDEYSDDPGDYIFNIFTTSGKIVDLKGSTNMRLNGNKSFDIKTDLLRRDKDGNIEFTNEGKERKDQLIKYRVDSDNNIIEITTAKYGYHEDEFSMTGTSRVDEYRPDRGRVGGYGYTDRTIFMRIPSLKNKDKFAIVNQSDIQQGSSFNIEVFDCNEVNFAKVILLKTDMATTAGDIDHLEPVTIVTSIGKSLVDDEIVYTLTGWRNGEEINLYSIEGDSGNGAVAIDPKKVFFNTDKTIKDLKPGDIIQYGTDTEGRIDRFKFLFGGVPSPQIDVYENGNEDAGLRNNILFNTVARRSGDYIVVNRSGGREIIFDISRARNVYAYNQSKRRFVKANQNDIIPGVTVFIHQNEWDVIDVVIYPDGSLN